MTDEIITPPAEPWYKGADDGLIGVLEARGLKDKTAVEAASNLAKAHAEAEKLIGVPASDVVRWPKDANDTANLQALRTRLGVPADPNEYDFSTLKKADGTDADPKFVAAMREAAKTAFIPKDQAAQFAKAVFDFNQKTAAEGAAERAARVNQERETLKTQWGANFDPNYAAASNVAKAMMEKAGMKPEDTAAAINALEGQIGGAKVMEMFRAFSGMAREDNFITPASNPGNVMSYQEAVATKAALLRDTGFATRWNNGDMDAAKQLDALERVIVSFTPQDDEAIFREQLMGQRARG